MQASLQQLMAAPCPEACILHSGFLYSSALADFKNKKNESGTLLLNQAVNEVKKGVQLKSALGGQRYAGYLLALNDAGRNDRAAMSPWRNSISKVPGMNPATIPETGGTGKPGRNPLRSFPSYLQTAQRRMNRVQEHRRSPPVCPMSWAEKPCSG